MFKWATINKTYVFTQSTCNRQVNYKDDKSKALSKLRILKLIMYVDEENLIEWKRNKSKKIGGGF